VSIAQIAAYLARFTGGDLNVEHAAPRPGDVYRHYADITKAKQLFDFRPSIDIESGLSQTVEWFRAHDIAGRVDANAAGMPNW
jgi:nucleoside-diphosphate-sugar epimerase